jgi:hypothetical protein
MKSETTTIALAAWNQYQQLVRNSAEAIWKIRAVFYTVSSALIAAGYASQQGFIYFCVPFVATLFLFLEGGHARVQIQYIRKSIEIERTLTDLLVGEEEPYLPSEGISTSLSTPNLGDFGALFSAKRYLYWLPYLIVVAVAAVLQLLEIHATAAS